MAVAFGTEVHVAPATGTNTGASPSITTPATNPVVIVHVALQTNTVTVSSLTITGFGGTATEVKNVSAASVPPAFVSIWKITAPTASTAGTVQANLSGSCPYQMSVSTFSGADQTDPSPTADAVTSTATTNPETLTPTNLTANDASSGCGGTTAANPINATPNSRYTDSTTAINMATGDATGTTGVTLGVDTGAYTGGKVVVRIKAAATAASDAGAYRGRRRPTRWSPQRGPKSFLRPSRPGDIIPIPLWWMSPWEERQPTKRLSDQEPPARGFFQAPQSPGWIEGATDSLLRRARPQDDPGARGSFQVPGFPGWIDSLDSIADGPMRRLPQDDPGARGFFQPPQIAGYIPNVADRLLARRYVDDAGTIIQPPAATPATTIAGMAWFEPWDERPVASKSKPESMPAIALTPDTLPPKIAGMAWFEPPDDLSRFSKPKHEFPPSVVLTAATLPTPVSGMGWFAPLDELSRFSKPKPELPQTPVLKPVTIPGIGWFNPWDELSRFSKPKLELPPSIVLTGPVPTPISGMAWFEPPDPLSCFSKPRLELPQTPVLQPVITPGIGWFNPWDELSRFSKPKPELPPAFVSTFRAAVIEGMAWLTQTDVAPSKPIRPIDVFGFVPQAAAAPVGISGMAWFAPWDELPRFSRPRFELPPGQIVGLFAGSVIPVGRQKDGDPDYWNLPWFHVEGESFSDKLRKNTLAALEEVLAEPAKIKQAAPALAKAVRDYAESDSLLLSDKEITKLGKLAKQLERAATQKKTNSLLQRAEEARKLLLLHEAIQQDEEEALIALGIY